ncbi:MAG: hypothetical protein RR595_10940 [Lysinibacillus sp.]
MTKASFVKCFALFLFSTGFLYGFGETYNIAWLQFQFVSDSNDTGFAFSFSSLTPVLASVFIVGLYEMISKWNVKRNH